MKKTRDYAVIGYPIAHSLSPMIHQQFASQIGKQLIYEKILGDQTDFEIQVKDFFNSQGKGLNVTLPFKERAFAIADVTTSRCKEAKAANTLWMQENLLHADNTDGVGLLRDLERYLDLRNKKILLLGAGGAARGIMGPLLGTGIAELTVTNRTFEKSLRLQQDFPAVRCVPLEELSSDTTFDVIINATAASLSDSEVIWPRFLFGPQTFCYDLAYRAHELTPFVAFAKQAGCRAKDGLGMLVEQAAEAFSIWHGTFPQTMNVLKILR